MPYSAARVASAGAAAAGAGNANSPASVAMALGDGDPVDLEVVSFLRPARARHRREPNRRRAGRRARLRGAARLRRSPEPAARGGRGHRRDQPLLADRVCVASEPRVAASLGGRLEFLRAPFSQNATGSALPRNAAPRGNSSGARSSTRRWRVFRRRVLVSAEPRPPGSVAAWDGVFFLGAEARERFVRLAHHAPHASGGVQRISSDANETLRAWAPASNDTAATCPLSDPATAARCYWRADTQAFEGCGVWRTRRFAAGAACHGLAASASKPRRGPSRRRSWGA